MADKKSKSRALKAVNDTKKKTGNPTTSVKKKDPPETPKKGSPANDNGELPISGRAIGAVVSLGLFILFLFMALILTERC